MTLAVPFLSRPSLRLPLGALVVLCLMGGVSAELVSDTRGPLDGMVFEGRIGPADDPDLPDYLYFEGGRFWSGECVRCGFEPGKYQVRHLDDGIAFRGVLKSADRGTFVYEGRIRGDEIDVAINWRHERWYWTIDRDLRFVGERLKDASTAMSLDKARELAASEAPRSDRCPS